MKNLDFGVASFKDFEDPEGLSAFERAAYFSEFLDYLEDTGRLNYRFETVSAAGPVVGLDIPFMGGRREYVSLVSNDYLGFSQHPLVKRAAVFGIQYFGTGTGLPLLLAGIFLFIGNWSQRLLVFSGGRMRLFIPRVIRPIQRRCWRCWVRRIWW